MTIQLSAFNAFLTTLQTELTGKSLPDDIDHDVLLAKVSNFVSSSASDEPYEKAIAAIIYLFAAILYANADAGEPTVEFTEGFQLSFKTGITMGAGLGSSASFGVCVAGALFFLVKEQKFPQYGDFFTNRATIEQQDEILSQISLWAFCSERIMHGTPSGLDNTVCTFGNVFKFYKGAKPTTVKLETALNILLVDTGVSRSTAKVVKKVADLKAAHPALIGYVLDGMGALVEDVVEILENRTPHTEIENYKKLKVLYSINNNLLRAIQVSHPSLEQIFSISERNAFSCKLTGAGAGGYAIVLLPPDFRSAPDYDTLCNELREADFQLKETTIGGSGFQIEL